MGSVEGRSIGETDGDLVNNIDGIADSNSIGDTDVEYDGVVDGTTSCTF